MRKRKVKCRICKNEMFNIDAYCKKSNDGKNIYYCTEDEYQDSIKFKEEKECCYETIKDILEINFIPPVLIKKVNEISEFYEYKIITKTFKEQEDIIRRSIQNKDFVSEFAKTKYIISIVANNIQKVKIKYIKEQQEIKKMFEIKNENIELDIINEQHIQQVEVQDKNISDISMFL